MFLAGTIVLLLGVMTVIGTLISDLLLVWIDPRIRLEGRESSNRARRPQRRVEAPSVTPSSASPSPRSGSSCGGASASTSWRWSARSSWLLFYLVVLFADFLAYADPNASEAQRSLMPAAAHPLVRRRALRPYVYALNGTRDPQTFKRVYVPDPARRSRCGSSPRASSTASSA